MSLFFQDSRADNDLILNTASQLLGPFRQSYAKAVSEVMATIRNGQPVEQAGKILWNTIQGEMSQSLQDMREKISTLQNTADNLRNLRDEQEKQLSTLKKELEQMQEEYELVLREEEEKRETIIIQNRLLARQHRKLQELLGDLSEDTEE